MKAKQLETIYRHHQKFLDCGKTKRPDDTNEDIALALLMNKKLPLRSSKDIINAARRAIVSDRWSKSVRFEDLFVSPNGGKISKWNAQESDRLRRVAAYRAIADPLIRHAELDDDSDAKEVLEALVAAAKKHNLYQ